MDISGIPLFKALAERMNWLSQRQEVISENVANADTPGYQPRDLVQPDFSQVLGMTAPGATLEPVKTSPLDISAGSPTAAQFQTQAETGSFLKKPDGNAVSLSQEMMKSSETATDYATAAALYEKQISLIRTALGTGGTQA